MCLVAGSGSVSRPAGGSSERSFFEGEVGVKVDLGGFDALVAEPEGDHGGVDASV
jgi:hypothetical protein